MSIEIKQFDLNLKRRFEPLTCTLDDFRSSDHCMRECLKLAWIAARTDLPVLILGESGTGKTLLARGIHNSSPRADFAFVSFNAAALSDSLLDSQLFGHERGAFTGAQRRIKGKFEIAHCGTLFVDEIADMSRAAQAKILRAIEYGEFERLGSEHLRRADVRLITASHLDLDEFISGRAVRKDLFYRLNGISVRIPPLRSREYDLPLMMAAEIEHVAKEQGKHIEGMSRDAARTLLNYHWPGNLRELNRVIHGAVAINQGPTLQKESILLSERGSGEDVPAQDIAASDLTLKSAERRHIEWVYGEMAKNKSRTAKALGISRSTLDRKLIGPTSS